jgi:hypothetical protein
MDCTRAESGLGICGGCSAVVASNYTRLVCAYCLQTLSDVLRQVWAFSIALDGSIHQGMSYVNVRVRFHFASKLLNLHLMAIPLFDRHTGENVFDVLVPFLDAVFPSRKKKCIAVSTDGARSMTGRSEGVVSRFHEVCQPGLVRIWCDLHQLDLVMQRVYKTALEGDFYKLLTALTGNLQRQVNLISNMNRRVRRCPMFAGSQWISCRNGWSTIALVC